jgi:hypothetical protein
MVGPSIQTPADHPIVTSYVVCFWYRQRRWMFPRRESDGISRTPTPALLVITLVITDWSAASCATSRSARMSHADRGDERCPPLAPLAPDQPRPACDAAHALERRGVGRGPHGVQESARAEESDSRRDGSTNHSTAPSTTNSHQVSASASARCAPCVLNIARTAGVKGR